MTEQWNKDFMNGLKEALDAVAPEGSMAEKDERIGMWYVKTILPVTEDGEYNLVAQAFSFPVLGDRNALELIYFLTNELKEETLDEVKTAVSELNFISPAGSFGIREKSRRLYLRDCCPIDPGKDLKEQITDAVYAYDILLRSLQSVYEGLRKVWEGEVTFDEAVEQGLLKKSPSE